MKRNTLCLALSCLMTLSLILAACTPAAPKPPPITPVAPVSPSAPPTPNAEPPQKEQAKPPADAPKYGGTIIYRLAADPTNFDSGTKRSSGALIDTVYQQFTSADWTRGPGGSNTVNFAAGANGIEDYTGQIAESWQMTEIGVWKFKIRHGIRWQPVDSEAGRLMANREVTADDIVSGFKRLMTATDSWIRVGWLDVANAATIEKTGPYEVTIKTPVNPTVGWQWIIQGAGFYRIYPPDALTKYGDVANWRNAVGTGPYMLKEYVPSSMFIFVKNPDYWEKDPIGPGKGNQLPYADKLIQLVMPDLSTTQAALITGKIDLLSDVTLADGQILMKTAPKMEKMTYLSNNGWGIAMRQDKKDKPFSDIRVRQALMLATDFNVWKNDYFGGNAEIDVYPVNKQVGIMYQPLSEMPPVVQDLFKYNPDKAKKLLNEAGYPNGFKTTIIVSNVAERIDELSIFKSMWAKVGVDIVMDVKEPAIYSTTFTSSTHPYDDMLYQELFGTFTIQMTFSAVRSAALNNPSHINDPPGTIPYIEELFTEYNKYIFADWPKAYEVFKKVKPYVLENTFIIPRPTPYTYAFWWPWVKNYYGQGAPFVRYAWVDQDMKKAMGY